MSFKKYAIYVESSKLSVESVKRVVRVAKDVGEIDITPYKGHDRYESQNLRKRYPFKILDKEKIWDKFCYFESMIGCFHSHFSLWEECVKSKEKIMVTEHDTIFKRKYVDFDFEGVVNFGRPVWFPNNTNDNRYLVDEKNGIKLSKWDCNCDKAPSWEHTGDLGCSPDLCNSWSLKGTHGYTITPKSAEKLIEKAHEFGIVPPDIHINRYNIDIAETVPHSAFQDDKFSLCTKHSDMNLSGKYNSDWVEGEEAWKV
jgi:hypothetical protein